MNDERIIVTFDRDYGELIFKKNYKPQMGVIYLRFEEYSPIEPGLIVERLLRHSDIHIQRTLTVIDKYGIRQRKF